MKKAIIILFAALFTFSFISCEEDTPKVVEVTSITITGATESQEVSKGTTLKLSATVLPDDATDKKVTWISSDEEKAKVDSTGVVTAKEEGTVTITAVASNGLKDEITLSVAVPRPSIFTVTFDDNKPDGVDAEVNDMPSAFEVTEGEKVKEPSTSPTLDGYEFIGWYTTSDADTPFDFETIISENTILYAKWIKEGTEITKYTVTFDANLPDGVTAEVENMPNSITGIVSGSTVEAPEKEPVLDGYVFSGWYRDGESDAFDFNTEIVEDVTLYAKWKEVVATPVISSERGDVYPKTIVTITTGTDEAEIFYTLDGSEPTVKSIKYTEPFEVSGTITVKAFATKNGVVSDIVSSEIVPTAFIKVVSPEPADEGYVFPLSIILEYEGEIGAEIKYGFDEDVSSYEIYEESIKITEDRLSDDGTVTLYVTVSVDGKEVASDIFSFKQMESSINATIELIQDTTTTGIFVVSADDVGNEIQYRLNGGEWKAYENYAVANIEKGEAIAIEVREKGYRPSVKKTVSYGMPDPVDFDAALFPEITNAAKLPEEYISYAIAPVGVLASDSEGVGPSLIEEAMATLIGSEGTALNGVLKYELPDNDYMKMKITFLSDTDMFSGDLGASGYPPLGTETLYVMYLKGSYIDLSNNDVKILLAIGEEEGVYDKENYYIISLDGPGLNVTDKEGNPVEDESIDPIAMAAVSSISMIPSAVMLDKLTESLGEVVSIENGKIRFDEFAMEGENLTLIFSLSLDEKGMSLEGMESMMISSDGITFSISGPISSESVNMMINGTCLIDNHSLVYSGIKIKGEEFGFAIAEGTLWFDGKAYDSL